RGRAAQLVPAAGVDDEQAAVGVLDHVGGVEVVVGGDDEVAVDAGEARPPGHQDVARHLAEVELGGEQVTVVFRPEMGGGIAVQAGGGGRPHVGEHGHEAGRGPVVGRVVDDGVVLAVDAAVDGVD